jgi:hypothetical protein
MTKRLSTNGLSSVRHQYVRKTAAFMNKKGHQCIARTVYTELSWNGTAWVKEQIMLISVARFAVYFEMEKIICIFYTPKCRGTMSTDTQPA